MVLEIIKGRDNPILHQKAEVVKSITPTLKRLALDMEETLLKKDGIGLAGPQVNQNLRIIQIDLSAYCQNPQEKDTYKMTLFNPRLIKKSWRQSITEEGCLSLPGLYLPIKRAEKVTVQALNLDGQEIQIKATGLLAKVLQHEIDHLDGILITDKIKK